MRRLLRALLAFGGMTGAAALVVRRVPPPEPPAPEPPRPPGEPRFVLPRGGTVRTDRGRPDEEEVVWLHTGLWVVGRGPTADLRLKDPTVSPEHLQVGVTADGAVVVRDLGSMNGVRVNGVPVRVATLVDANRVDLGAATLVFHRDDHDDGGRQGGELGELSGT